MPSAKRRSEACPPRFLTGGDPYGQATLNPQTGGCPLIVAAIVVTARRFSSLFCPLVMDSAKVRIIRYRI